LRRPRRRRGLLALGELWSRGSRKHINGSCTICAFVFSARGCSYGTDCKFCHIPHASGCRKKLGMARRLKVKAIADALEQAYHDDLILFRAVSAVAGSRCPVLEGLMQRRIAALEGGAADEVLA